MNRRTLLAGLFAAPAIIRTPGLLMAIRAPRPVSWAYIVSIEPLPDGSYRIGPWSRVASHVVPTDKLVARSFKPLTKLAGVSDHTAVLIKTFENQPFTCWASLA